MDSDFTVAVGAFDSLDDAGAAYEQLTPWANSLDHVSMSRLGSADGTGYVAIVTMTASDHSDECVQRLKDAGGTITDIPEADKVVLVRRFIDVAEARAQEDES